MTILFTFSSSAQKKDLGLSYLLEQEDIDGVMLFYDEKSKRYKTTSKMLSRRHTLPGSTFKIINSLLLLELGIIKGPDHMLKWEGKQNRYRGQIVEAWNKDTDMKEAFKNSTVWYYSEMSRDIPLGVYRDLLRECKYGALTSREKRNLDFWNYGSRLRIEPKHQIKLLKQLANNELPFEDKHQETVKELMVERKTADYTLRGKTGLAQNYHNSILGDRWYGWYVGYVETEDNLYYFATRLIEQAGKERDDFLKLRRELTYKGLRHLYDIDVDPN